MRIENAFDVPAPVDEAWRLLNDVPAVVPCMPGAELVEVAGENAWKARLHVKLGPIALQFLADVTREQVDEGARRAVLAVKAREAKGRGSAEATIESSLAGAGSGTHVALATELVLRGAVAQYGRGVVGDVASRLTERFAECIARKLETPGDVAAAAAAPGEARPVGGLRLVLGALWRSLFRRGGRP
ncbi:MAG TPA: SRPBCC family protein [Gaiellaceae bacterium]|nr:SRPBCC family protein [Gaiellaceae bacterium]